MAGLPLSARLSRRQDHAVEERLDPGVGLGIVGQFGQRLRLTFAALGRDDSRLRGRRSRLLSSPGFGSSATGGVSAGVRRVALVAITAAGATAFRFFGGRFGRWT
jgi:hypothetical protein